MPPLPLSHTRIEAWDSCRRYFRAIYIDKVPQTKTRPLLVGGFFHDWAERYVKHLMREKQQSDLTHGRLIFEEQWVKRAAGEYAQMPEGAYEEVAGLVEKFLETHLFDPDQVAAVELELAFNREWKTVEWRSPEAFFRMKIDRIEISEEDGQKVCTIIDYKTSQAAEAAEQIPKNPQLKRYLMGVARFLKADRYRAGLDYVRLNYKRMVDLDIDEAEKEVKRVVARSAQIEAARLSGDFPATPGESCNWCPVFDQCPAKTEAKTFRGVTTEADAIAAVQRLILMDRERKQLTDGLKVYTKNAGPVETGGMVYGPSPRVERTFGLDEVTKWAQRFGVPLVQLLKVSNEAFDKQAAHFEKYAKAGNPEAVAAVAALPTPEERMMRSEYRLKKASGDEA